MPEIVTFTDPFGEGKPLELEATDLSADLQEAVRRRETALRNVGLQWPGIVSFGADIAGPAGPDIREEDFLRHLVDRNRAVQVASDYFVHSDTLAETIAALRGFFRERAEISFSEFRELTGLTRKLGIPLLEHLDQTGVTRRVGDARQAGSVLDGED